MRKSALLLAFLFACVSIQAKQPTINRTILFIIDGIHWQAPDRLAMPNFSSLVSEGTYIQRSYVIIPHHPRVGVYSQENTCSFPNPVMQEGTLFLSQKNKMIQEYFWPEKRTAFVVNTPVAYRSISRGFSTLIMDESLSDYQVVEKSIEILKSEDPAFMRIHLQTPGNEGYNVWQSGSYKSIYDSGSPYVEAIEKADQSLGLLIEYLKSSGKWDNTLLIVTSDHGQSLVGWHPLFDEESWITPTIFVGPGIAKGHTLDYFEHTDIAPTIAGLNGIVNYQTNGGSGRFVKEILSDQKSNTYASTKYLKKFNEQIREYNLLRAQMIVESEKDASLANVVALLESSVLIQPFYTQDRVTEWSTAGDISRLIEVNEKALVKMRDILKSGSISEKK